MTTWKTAKRIITVSLFVTFVAVLCGAALGAFAGAAVLAFKGVSGLL